MHIYLVLSVDEGKIKRPPSAYNLFVKEHMKPYLAEIDRVIEKGPYKDTWESLGSFQPPKWYRDAKFGIFIHWGVYSVPGWGNSGENGE